MSELDLGLVTSIITFLCLIIFGYFTGETIGKTEVLGFAGALAGLIVWYYNEKHNSDLISGGDNELEAFIEADEQELINPEYYDEEEETEV